MLGDSSSAQSRQIKIAGALVAAVALVVVGVVALNGMNDDAAMMPLDKVQALVHAEGANAPLSSLPDESSVETPAGWVIESDEPVDGPGSEEHIEEGSDVTEESPEVDEDIDSRMEFEEGQDGQKYVAELEADVIVTGAGADATTGETAEDLSVEADYKGKSKGCYRKLKACGAKKACVKKCQKKCKPYAIRKCMNKKFCRCFCKYYGKIRKAKKCVIYKRRQCKTSTIYRCRRACKKTCKKVLRCYCCPRSKVTKKCYNLCKKYMYRSKCKKCRCQLTKCVRRCKFLCTHKY